MVFHILTIFPQFFQGPFQWGVVGRAAKKGSIEIRVRDLRDYTFDRHRTVDDRPFGGDEGMVMKVEPIFRACEEIRAGTGGGNRRVVALSAQGRLFDQSMAARLAEWDELVLICGRYEGVDERVADFIADEEVSIGDFVLSGGEWAAGIVVDTVARLRSGVVGNELSLERESFAPRPGGGVGILDFPHYSRPASFGKWNVPEVLLSGNHEQIRRWRRRAALEKTRRNRPELLAQAELSNQDRDALALAATEPSK